MNDKKPPFQGSTAYKYLIRTLISVWVNIVSMWRFFAHLGEWAEIGGWTEIGGWEFFFGEIRPLFYNILSLIIFPLYLTVYLIKFSIKYTEYNKQLLEWYRESNRKKRDEKHRHLILEREERVKGE